MSFGRDIVVTAYGHNNVIEKIAISFFDESKDDHWRNKRDNAHAYCKMINSLEIKGDSWIFANLVPENTPVSLDFFSPLGFPDYILKMTDRNLQKVFRETNNDDLAKAFKGCGESVLSKMFKNMSKRGGAMLREDMEHMGPIKLKDAEESQEKIMAIIRHLEDVGEISITYSKKEEL